jgi:predicted ATPase with chaperone activity
MLVAAMNPCPCGWRAAERPDLRVRLLDRHRHPLPEAHQRPAARPDTTPAVGAGEAAITQLQLSARTFHRVLTCACAASAGKLSRTIADLAGAERIQPAHLAEAIQYRPRRQAQ